jgi:small subunit ribosomal protein S4
VNISSYTLKAGDIVGVREKSQTLEVINDSLAQSNTKKFNWINWDGKAMNGTFLAYPERDQIPENIKEQLIVELYSK